MAIAPITGMFKRQVIRDVGSSFGRDRSLATIVASYYWFYVHKPYIKHRSDGLEYMAAIAQSPDPASYFTKEQRIAQARRRTFPE
ncbi:uncharacterized protein V1518DRAFT_425739 [Limtongia smithiae]|uniref:uncharacterized protein n=1 Tax=Limtongia smithiae TaxID=1125753 RepID=UPI0034CE829B